MNFQRYETGISFQESALHFLLHNEAEHSLILSVFYSILKDPNLYKNLYFASGSDRNGEIAYAALMTLPYNLILTKSSESFISSVIEDLIKSEIIVPGVMGNNETSLMFAEKYSQLTGAKFQITMRHRLYSLTDVILPDIPDGKFRKAEDRDSLLLLDFCKGFVQDSGVDTHISAEDQLNRLLVNGLLYVFENIDNTVVSMAAEIYGDTPNCQRIGLVYTPPELRKNGYASAVVALLSLQILNSGKKFCNLFTDLSNPTSNSIYQNIGYKEVSDFDVYKFIPV